jgi:hypothetical protein
VRQTEFNVHGVAESSFGWHCWVCTLSWNCVVHLTLPRIPTIVIKYQQPLPELHRCAIIVQKCYRNWIKTKKSPLSLLYKERLEGTYASVQNYIRGTKISLPELHRHATIIQRWWRPIFNENSRLKAMIQVCCEV